MKAHHLSEGPTGVGGGLELLVVSVLCGIFAACFACMVSYCLGGGLLCGHGLV